MDERTEAEAREAVAALAQAVYDADETIERARAYAEGGPWWMRRLSALADDPTLDRLTMAAVYRAVGLDVDPDADCAEDEGGEDDGMYVERDGVVDASLTEAVRRARDAGYAEGS